MIVSQSYTLDSSHGESETFAKASLMTLRFPSSRIMSGSVENCSSVISLYFASECSGGSTAASGSRNSDTASNYSQKPRCEKPISTLPLCSIEAMLVYSP